jgi:hypothetical protein
LYNYIAARWDRDEGVDSLLVLFTNQGSGGLANCPLARTRFLTEGHKLFLPDRRKKPCDINQNEDGPLAENEC